MPDEGQYSVPHDNGGDTFTYRLRRVEADVGHTAMDMRALDDKLSRRMDRLDDHMEKVYLPRTEFQAFVERMGRLETWIMTTAGGTVLTLISVVFLLIIALNQVRK